MGPRWLGTKRNNILPATTTSAITLPTSNSLVNNDKSMKRSFILQPTHSNYLNTAYSATTLNTAPQSQFQAQAYRNLAADYYLI